MSTRRSEAAIGLAVADNMCEITRRLIQQCGNGVVSFDVSEKGRPLLHPDSCQQFIYLAENSSEKPEEIFTE